MYVYALPPLDHGWQYLRTVQDTLVALASEDVEFPGFYEFIAVSDFIQEWDNARNAAKHYGWEGDFRGEPRVLWLPTGEIQFEPAFVFKQDNNGTTFVVSPVELPFLNDRNMI